MTFKGHADQHYGHVTYSQHGEDLLIVNLFKLIGIEKPSYLDVGAHHPVNISNTALLYERGSRGINVEANRFLMADFAVHRPEDINLNLGVGPRPGKLTFHKYDDTSGLNTFSEEEAKKFPPGGDRCIEEVEVITLDQIVDKHYGGLYPDLLSIDVEGMDYETLESARIHQVGAPKIICVEVRREKALKMKQLLGWSGFMPVVRMGENLIFIQNRFLEVIL